MTTIYEPAAVTEPARTPPGRAELMRLIEERLDRQRRAYPPGFPCDRNGIRLGLASIEDELRETLTEWDGEKRRPFTPQGRTFDELLDVIAVAVYVAEAFCPQLGTDPEDLTTTTPGGVR